MYFLKYNLLLLVYIYRGQEDTFTMVSRNLGNLTRCYLGLVENDNIGAVTAKDSTWHCDKVVVTNMDTNDKYINTQWISFLVFAFDCFQNDVICLN